MEISGYYFTNSQITHKELISLSFLKSLHYYSLLCKKYVYIYFLNIQEIYIYFWNKRHKLTLPPNPLIQLQSLTISPLTSYVSRLTLPIWQMWAYLSNMIHALFWHLKKCDEGDYQATDSSSLRRDPVSVLSSHRLLSPGPLIYGHKVTHLIYVEEEEESDMKNGSVGKLEEKWRDIVEYIVL